MWYNFDTEVASKYKMQETINDSKKAENAVLFNMEVGIFFRMASV